MDDKKYTLQKEISTIRTKIIYNNLIGKRNVIIVQNQGWIGKVFKFIQGVKKPHFRLIQGISRNFG